MKFLKWTALAILTLAMVGVLCRGWFYRYLITYKSIGPRTTYSATNEKLVDYINTRADEPAAPDIEQIIKLGLSITSDQLNFTANKNDTDPNKLITSRTAHCVGYAAFFATTCNQLLAQHNLSTTWTAKPQVGQLYLLGTNVHSYFHTPFFKDHDFVTIENKVTGELFAVDPTVNDYLWIDFVTYAK
jgi:hypothetical protein